MRRGVVGGGIDRVSDLPFFWVSGFLFRLVPLDGNRRFVPSSYGLSVLFGESTFRRYLL